MRQLKITQQITNRESQSVEKYLQEIDKIPLITPEREVQLAKLIRQGNQQALEELVNANLRFVVSVAKQYQGSKVPLSDLINEGNLGLTKAAKKFDETKGFKFISYAVWWIRQTIMKHIAENRSHVRIPMNKVGTLNKALEIISFYEQEFDRRPTEDELVEILNIKPYELNKLLSLGTGGISLDASASNDSDDDNSKTIGDLLTDENNATDGTLIGKSLPQQIAECMNVLSQREQLIIKLYYGFDGPEQTLEEIGEDLDLTRERVRQIKEKALAKMRKSSFSAELMN